MPDKRNVSKQRRAARNRATRDSLAARRENAVTTAPIAPSRSSRAASSGSSSSRGSSTTTKRAAAGRAGARPARPVPVAVGPPPKGIMGTLQSRRPGDRALVVAFALAIVSALYSLAFVRIDVDDRGEPLPLQFRALTLLAREATGHDATVHSESMISAYGPIIILLVLTPVLITGYALWVNRRVDRARVLTFVLIAMAVATMLSGGGASPVQAFLSFGALIALGIGVFQIRKADTQAALAASPPPDTGGGRGDVIDAEASEDAPAAPQSLLQRLLGPGPAARGPRGSRTGREEPADAEDVDADPAGETEDDPLAELEAELAAEADRDADGDDDAPSGNGPRRRRR